MLRQIWAIWSLLAVTIVLPSGLNTAELAAPISPREQVLLSRSHIPQLHHMLLAASSTRRTASVIVIINGIDPITIIRGDNRLAIGTEHGRIDLSLMPRKCQYFLACRYIQWPGWYVRWSQQST